MPLVPIATSKSVLSTDAEMCVCNNCSMCTPVDEVNASHVTSSIPEITSRDASWILTSAVIIFTMQTGFGLLESGCVNAKSEINIMVKNALDVVFGGITYWIIGFGLSFGTDPGTNAFVGYGNFFVMCPEDQKGFIYALFLFQLSFSTTATTIVSGAMAERTKLLAYNVFSFVNTFVYCLPAHWVWAENGFLYKLGVLDVAGCGPVHLVGGVTGLIATLMLGPRRSALKSIKSRKKEMIPGPVKAILGMFMLWWGWLRFNSGSVFLVSTSSQWKLAVAAAVNTILASMGGGLFSVILSIAVATCYRKESKYDVGLIVGGVLGALVSITSICTMCEPWEAFIIGCIGPFLTLGTEELLWKLKVDDPVGVIPVHLVCAVWGLLSVGLFIPEEMSIIPGESGLFKSGRWYMLGIQTLAAVVIAAWTAASSYLCLKVIDLAIGLRLSAEHEDEGADFIEHGMFNFNFKKVTAAKQVNPYVLGGIHEGISTISRNCTANGSAGTAQLTDVETMNKVNSLINDILHSCEQYDIKVFVSDPTHGITLQLSTRQEDDDHSQSAAGASISMVA